MVAVEKLPLVLVIAANQFAYSNLIQVSLPVKI